ncbi:transposase [Streptosporangium lutulentum]|uniref:Transposase n=1 Tax=Streptosporangium lutulentum TaxID=1461250 RepID=A0ABT9Q972_9ACTN|nr:transposase [Streptosporangium lutulentum]MDP9842946.1 transposase [Streptosporangium lutulentum]
MDDRLKRGALTDDEWARLELLLPAPARRGRRWADHRVIVDGVFFRFRTGCSWRGLPEVYGSWKTVYGRYRRWSADGTWKMILDALRPVGDEVGGRAFGARPRVPEDIRPWKRFEVADW